MSPASMQRPTCTNTRIRSTADAHALFYAVKLGRLPIIRRRPDAEERLALRSGDVYIWEERTRDSETSSMGRFTEGRRWSESRTREEFFFYYERYRPPPDVARSSSSGKPEPPADWEQMVKQTYSVMIDIDGSPKKWHLTAYFTHRTVDGLGTIDELEDVRGLEVPPGLCVSTRTNNKRQKAQRRTVGTGSPMRSSTAHSRTTRKFAAFGTNVGTGGAGGSSSSAAGAGGSATGPSGSSSSLGAATARNPYPMALSGTPPPSHFRTGPGGGRYNSADAALPGSPQSTASPASSHSWLESPVESSTSLLLPAQRASTSRARAVAMVLPVREEDEEEADAMDVDVPAGHPALMASPFPPFADYTNATPTTRATRATSAKRTPSPTRSLAPLRTLERAHPYRRDPADERALRLLVFASAAGGSPPPAGSPPRGASRSVEPPAHFYTHEYAASVDRRLGIESY